ncbi:hypothetical protein DH2020_041964 [Rehmannia glutinosa]|uniref:Uncharacterized protein n=1 Tax=Rehmannia glutinosa TaxID=99300 RepID=A0ABR0UNW3_REHGL
MVRGDATPNEVNQEPRRKAERLYELGLMHRCDMTHSDVDPNHEVELNMDGTLVKEKGIPPRGLNMEETPIRTKETTPRGYSPSLQIQDQAQKEVEDPMINMRSSDLEKLIERRMEEKVRKGKAPMVSPPRELPKANEAEIGDEDRRLEDIEEVASRLAPRARPPMANQGELPKAADINELSDQIEQATRKLDNLRRKGAVTSALQKT